jgi:hemoglobin
MPADLSPMPPAPALPPTLGSPYAELGGAEAVARLARHFYDVMERDEPELARLHRGDERGLVGQVTRERFASFLVFWLGGPGDYLERHGHPRLRMRHASVPVTPAMRDAWLRCMQAALDEIGANGQVRSFLDQRFKDVAQFLVNR